MLIVGFRGPGRLYTWHFILQWFLKDEEMFWRMMVVASEVEEEEVEDDEHTPKGRIFTSRAWKHVWVSSPVMLKVMCQLDWAKDTWSFTQTCFGLHLSGYFEMKIVFEWILLSAPQWVALIQSLEDQDPKGTNRALLQRESLLLGLEWMIFPCL